MRVEGEDLAGVLPGTDFLRAVTLNEPVELGKRVAVLGGGNTAIDAARTALRLDAEEVTILYRRSRQEMPATDWEVEEAEEENVGLKFLTAPVAIRGENGRVNTIECIKMELGEPDSSGRRRPVPIEGSEFVLEVDSVIAAIGQRPDVSCLD
jgi:NADPH-dependent glutamate synthase beta subunit-like oxidoreductase